MTGTPKASGRFRPINARERAAANLAEKIAARRRTIEHWVDKGFGSHAISKKIGYKHISGLLNWMSNNAPDLRERLRVTRHPGGKPVARDEAVKRLRMLVVLKEAGMDPHRLASWARVNVPDGDYVLALGDYVDGDDPAGVP